MGVKGNILKWIESYLKNRTQKVKLMDHISRPIKVSSSVPQGSHLGPLLFLLFINDLSQLLKNSTCWLYADDLKICKRIDDGDAVKILQNELNFLNQWCVSNNLLLNISKCSFITFYRGKNKILSSYVLNDQDLERKSVINDLGIILDEKMTFGSHYGRRHDQK